MRTLLSEPKAKVDEQSKLKLRGKKIHTQADILRSYRSASLFPK